MAKVSFKNGVITIDTNALGEAENSGILKILIDMTTHEASMSMLCEENVDKCIMCDDVIPEGRMVCPSCENRTLGSNIIGKLFSGSR